MKNAIRRTLNEYAVKNLPIGKKQNDSAIRLSIVSNLTDLLPRLAFNPYQDFIHLAFQYSKYETIVYLLNNTEPRTSCSSRYSWGLMKAAMKREDLRISWLIVEQCEMCKLCFPLEPVEYSNGFLCGKSEAQVKNMLELHSYYERHSKGFAISYTHTPKVSMYSKYCPPVLIEGIPSTFLNDIVSTGNVNAVRMIVEHITQKEGPIQISVDDKPFLMAVENGYIDIMRYLLKFRKDVAKNPEVEMASICAIKNIESVRFLIENNMFNARCRNYNPLRNALYQSNVEMARMILALCPELTDP